MLVVLETERLFLRCFTVDDADAILLMESDPEVLRYVGRIPLADAESYRKRIQTFFLPYYDRPDGFGPWAIIERASGEFVGGCSLKPALNSRSAAAMSFGPDEIEMGYGLRKSSWGCGYATELTRALVRRAFTEMAVGCVVACVTLANLASVRVLEKAGLRRTGEAIILPGEDLPSVKYTLTKDQFDQDELC